MVSRILGLAIMAGLLSFHSLARAWGDQGHRIVAAVAYAHISPHVRKQVDALIAEELNPRQRDFVSSATWANMIVASGDPQQNRQFLYTRQWHFADADLKLNSLESACNDYQPLRPGILAREGPPRDCIVNKIEQFASDLRDPSVPRGEKVVALKFLIHLVGDLHQPLHVADNGSLHGAALRLRHLSLARTNTAQNLQQFWNEDLVRRIESVADPGRSTGERLLREVPASQVARWAMGGPRDWGRESIEIARSVAYNFEGIAEITEGRGKVLYMDTPYVERALPVAKEQLLKAGIRLGALLGKSLAPPAAAVAGRSSASKLRGSTPKSSALAKAAVAWMPKPIATPTVALASARDEPEPLEFRLAAEVLPGGTVQLANGVEVNAADWPTLIMAQVRTSSGKLATCTATLVGPNVALMAAHCVDNPLSSRPLAAFLVVDGRRLLLQCELHPHYLRRAPRFTVPRGSEDYALCLLDDGGTRPASLRALSFDVLDSRSPLKPGEPVLMTGYGCSQLGVEDGRLTYKESPGVLRIGDEHIEKVASGAPAAPTYLSVRSERGLEPALCPGDSGGPLFSGVSTTQPNLVRRVRGVNSMVALERRGDGGYDFVSSIAATGTPLFHAWAEDWVKRHESSKAELCGMNRKPGQLPCRD